MHTALILAVAALATSPLSASATEPAPAAGGIPVLVVGGANNHDCEWTTPELARMLEEAGRFDVTVTTEPARAFADLEALRRYRCIVLDYNGPRWGEPAESNFLEAVRGGVGVAVIHAANNAFPGWVEYEKLVGLLWRNGTTGHGRFHAFDVRITDRDHPITRDLPDLVAHPDELYHRLVNVQGVENRVLATAFSREELGGSGAEEPMIIVRSYGKGRVFHTPLGHVWRGVPETRRSHRDPQFRELVARGVEWAATGDVAPPSARPANRLTEAEREAGWELLFDGSSTAGWRGYGKAAFPEQGWVVEDGTLHHLAGGGGGDLVSEREFQDFELAFQWKVAPGANSGVMYRVRESEAPSYMTGAEYQILDDAAYAERGGDPKHSAGALYDLFPAEGKHLAPTGEWNRARILVIGDHIEHWLNGVKVVSCDRWSERWKQALAASKFAKTEGFAAMPTGRIALQDHGDEVWYRDIKVRDLAPKPERERDLFDHESLAGWTCFLLDGGKLEDVWSVTDDGVLVCKGNPIGYLRTTEDFTNYTLRVRWRFDPEKGAGNSGVLLRMIGEDKVWPRSIEAQLQSGAAGDFWNIDEFPMQVDPTRTNGRNTRRLATNEKPLGEWNEYQITVWHGHVVLRVNGKLLNQAWDCMEVPGKICLQSEGAEIHFADVKLMPLP